MNHLKELLKKTTKDLKKYAEGAEMAKVRGLQAIEQIEDKEQQKFMRDMFYKAISGKLDIDTFIKQVNGDKSRHNG